MHLHYKLKECTKNGVSYPLSKDITKKNLALNLPSFLNLSTKLSNRTLKPFNGIFNIIIQAVEIGDGIIHIIMHLSPKT